MHDYRTYQTRKQEEDFLYGLWRQRREDQHAVGDADLIERETDAFGNELVHGNGIDAFQQEEDHIIDGELSDFDHQEEIDPQEQEKLKDEFSVYAEHKLELINQGINLGSADNKKVQTKEEKKDKFIAKRDRFQKRMNRSGRNFWGTKKYYRLLNKWFPDYADVLAHKVAAIKTTIDDSITSINKSIIHIIEVLKEAIIKADTDIGKALQLINVAEDYLNEADQYKDNAVLTLTGFEENKTRDFLAQYDMVLDIYQELILNLQTNIGAIERDKNRFETFITQLSQQQNSLVDFNLKIQNTSDVLELIKLQDTAFSALINATEKIIEDAEKAGRIAGSPDEKAVQTELDAGKTTISTLNTRLEEFTGGVSSVYWGKGIYYNEEVDALYIVAKDYSAASHYARVTKFDGFWFFVDKETGWTSGIQQRDAFKKFYAANPVRMSEFSDLAAYMNHAGIVTATGKAVTAESLLKLQSEDAAAFRKIIESVQARLFGTKNIKGYGLYTASTKSKIQDFNRANILAKKKTKRPENLEMVFTPFSKPGIVSDSGADVSNQEKSGANLRSAPEIGENIISWLPFNTRVYIQAKTSKELGWYFVKTEFGEDGYVAQWLINTNLPNSDARMYVVKQEDTALGIARKFYSRYSKESMGQVQSALSGQDYRNYVDKLVQYNKNTPGIYYKGGKEWKNAQLTAGMRIWVPSPMTMYEMMRSTPTKDLHGKSKYFSLAQDVFDYAPQNLLIHQFLKLWRSIPAEEINKSLQAVDEVALYILKSLRMSNMEWLDAILTFASPGTLAAVKSLAFIREFTIGYIEYMHSLDAQTRVKSMERFLFSYTQVDYFIGMFEGIVNGVTDWFKDIWGIFEGIYDFIVKLPEYYEKIKEVLGQTSQLVIDIIEFLNEPSSAGSIKELLKNFNPLDIFTWIDAGIEKAGKNAGAFVGRKIIEFLNLPPVELGRKVGWLIGYLIPEILLAVFSAGIGTAIKVGAQAIARVAKIIFQILGKVVRVTVEAMKIAIVAIDDVIKSIKAIAGLFIKKGNKQVSKFFTKLEELFKQFKEFLKKKQKSQEAPPSKKPDAGKKSPDAEKPKESGKFEDKESSLDEGKAVKESKWVDEKGNIKWPPNDGFAGTPKKMTLQPGTRIDRYGYEGGTFVSPEGIPYNARSLAPGTELKPYNVYEVVKPIDGLEGKIAPWFDEVGGGIQYKLNQSIKELLDGGYIKKVN